MNPMTGGRSGLWLAAIALSVVAALALAHPGESDARRKSPPSAPPPLRITAVTLSPLPYVPSQGPLDVAVEVELPRDLDGATILEVSSLISSPSKRSMRFLSARQPVQPRPEEAGSVAASLEAPAPSAGPARRPIAVVRLSWDGTDQTKQQVTSGKYSYEVRAKLLVVGENGPRTHMVSWIRRGVLDVTE